jgi:hypothetical protein
VLRIGDLGVARGKSEEPRVELADPVEHPGGPDVGGVVARGRVHSGSVQILVGEPGDGLDAVAQVAPEGGHVRGAREAAGHAHDGDAPAGRHRGRRADGEDLAPFRGEERRHGRHGGVAEQVHQLDLPLQGLAQPALHLDQQQRVAAQVEEVVVAPHGVEVEHLAPGFGHDLLHLAAGPGFFTGRRGRRFGRGQGAAVHLAVGRQGERSERHPGGRHHVLRQALSERGPQGGHVEVLPGQGDDVGDEARRGAVRAGEDDGLAHAGLSGEHGLDLAQLDAEAADLHLVVQAAQV